MSNDQFHLKNLPENHVRNVWQPDTDDLHMNVLVLRAGESIGHHVNQLLDVVVTCLRGSGTITIDDETITVEPGSIVLIRQGADREIEAGPEGIMYTTVHRKRGGIMPTMAKPSPRTPGRESQ